MEYKIFWEILYESQKSAYYITIYFIMLGCVVFLFKKSFITRIDPLLVTLVSQCSLIFVISILYHRDKVRKEIFYELLFISVFFLISLRFFLCSKKRYIIDFNFKKLNFKIFYIIHTTIFLLTSFISFNHLITGIAFKEKLIAYSEKGLLNYFVTIIIPGEIIVVLIKRNLYGVKKKIDYLYLCISIFIMILSGSKVSLIFVLFYMGVTNYLIGNKKFIKKMKLSYKEVLGLLLVLGVTLVILKFESKTGYGLAIQKFVFRIVSEADLYFLYYSNNIYEKIEKVDILTYYTSFFEPLVRRLTNRVFNHSMGGRIIEEVYGRKGLNFGPNTRAEMIWRDNLGFLGIILSIITAYIIATIRKIKSNNFISIYTLTILIVNIDLVLRDIQLFNLVIRGMLVVIPLLAFLTLLISSLKNNLKYGRM